MKTTPKRMISLVAAMVALLAALSGCEQMQPTPTPPNVDDPRESQGLWGAIAHHIVYVGTGNNRRSVEMKAFAVTDEPSEMAAQRAALEYCMAETGSPFCSGSGSPTAVYSFSTSSQDPGPNEGARKIGRCAAIVWANPPRFGSTTRGTGIDYIAYGVGPSKAVAESNARAQHQGLEYSQVVGSACNSG